MRAVVRPGDSGRQPEDLGVIARYQRQAFHHPFVGDVPQRAGLSIQLHRFGLDRDHLIDRAHLHLEIQSCGFRDTDPHLLDGRGLESASRSLHFVQTRRQQWHHVSSITLRSCRSDLSRRLC